MNSDIGGINTQVEPDLNTQQAQIAANTQTAAAFIRVPDTGAVGSINGLQGTLTIVGSTNIAILSSGTTITVSTTGLGTMATKNQAAALANSVIVAGAVYSQTDFQSVIDTLNQMLTNYRTAGHQAP